MDLVGSLFSTASPAAAWGGHPAVPAALLGLAAVVLMALPAWAISVYRQDASLADRVWSAFIAVPATLYAWQLGADARTLAMVAILWSWAVRLAVYVTVRNWGHGEDRRYRDMRERNQPGFAWKSLYLVFLLQATLGWMVSWPLLAASSQAPVDWQWLDSVGAALAVAGLVMESVADAQVARFRQQPANRHRVLDSGLWRYSRHPNYFGECCLWWGLALMSLSAGGWASAWALLSPLLMTFLLLRVSGVTLLEKDIGERRPGYRDYVARTSAFIPWPPKRSRVP